MSQPVPTYAPASPSRNTFKSLVPVPAVVNVAFWILVGGSVLTAILLILSVIGLVAASSGVAAPMLTVTVLGGMIGLLIRVGIAVMLRRGYGPARIFLTVVTVYSVVINALNGFDPIGVLVLASVVVPVVLVWVPQANQYFRTVGQARCQAKASGMKLGFLG